MQVPEGTSASGPVETAGSRNVIRTIGWFAVAAQGAALLYAANVKQR
jgi:hypothetical protein